MFDSKKIQCFYIKLFFRFLNNMAEAHSAVAFSFSITHEGWDVNFDREVLHLVWASGIRSWKKRLARFKVKYVV